MAGKLNNNRLNNLMRGIQSSIKLFPDNGHTEVYFSAQFYSGGKKQNCIERGELESFSKLVRTYILSEEADSVRIDFISEKTGKSIYSKVLSDLRKPDAETASKTEASTDNAQPRQGYFGLGEAQLHEMIDKKVAEIERANKFESMSKELEELRKKNEEQEETIVELRAENKAKSSIEFYSGLIGNALPGIGQLLANTPLAGATSFLAGLGTGEKESLTADDSEGDEEASTITALITEFCATLNQQEQSALHLLFMAFEKDRNTIQDALRYITVVAPTQRPMANSSSQNAASKHIAPPSQAKAA